MNDNKNSTYYLLFQILAIIIVLYGLHLRFATIAQTQVINPIRADAVEYFNYAGNLATKGVFSRLSNDIKPDALRPPGFPAFAAIFYNAQDHMPTIYAQTILQIGVFILLSLLLYQHLSKPIYIVFLLMLWTFPHWISMNVYFLSESLFISLIAIFICIATKKELSRLDWLLLGLCIAAASLTRFTTEYFCIFLGVFLFLRKQVTRQKIIIFIVAGVTPIVLWKIRNYIQIGSFTDPTLTINGLYHGSFVDFMYNNDPQSQGIAYRFDPAVNQYNSTSNTIALIFERIKQNPIDYLYWYSYGKQTFLWRWDILAGMGDIWVYPISYTAWYELPDMQLTHTFHHFLHLFWVPASLALAVYCFVKHHNNHLLFICAALVIYAILIHGITAPYPRYGIPFKLPLLILLLLSIDILIKHTFKRVQ